MHVFKENAESVKAGSGRINSFREKGKPKLDKFNRKHCKDKPCITKLKKRLSKNEAKYYDYDTKKAFPYFQTQLEEFRLKIYIFCNVYLG